MEWAYKRNACRPIFCLGETMNTLPIDELNTLRSYLTLTMGEITYDECEDEVLDILIIGWANGLEYSSGVLGENNLDYSDLQNALEKRIEDKTYKDRIREHFEQGDIDGIIRVADTESHRLFNTAVFENAERSEQTVFATWETMMDDKVRETHDFLEGVTVPLGERFYTSDGDSARFPGDFAKAENNVGCRCWLNLRIQKGEEP